MIGCLTFPLCEKDGFVDLCQLLAEVLSRKSAVHSEALGKLCYILDVEPF
jgi:hypothetical protein